MTAPPAVRRATRGEARAEVRPGARGEVRAPASAEERLARREAVLHRRRVVRLQLARPPVPHRTPGR